MTLALFSLSPQFKLNLHLSLCYLGASLTVCRIIFARCRYSWHWFVRSIVFCWIACTLHVKETTYHIFLTQLGMRIRMHAVLLK